MLAYTWRRQAWLAEWADAVVRCEVTAAGAGTQVRLTHAGFPDAGERDRHAEGWDVYWLTPRPAWLADK